MKVLVDMNLAPLWAEVLRKHGREALHWSQVGNPRAPDREIMEWARVNGYIVFTHDLDFGTLLAATGHRGPSVIQVRTHDVTPGHLEDMVLQALSEHERMLEAGALLTIDKARARVRILPLVR